MLTVNETRFDVLVTSALLPSVAKCGTKWHCYVMENGIFFFVTATNVNKITSIVAVVSAMEQLFQELRHLDIELVSVRAYLRVLQLMVCRVMNWMSSNWNPALVKPIQV